MNKESGHIYLYKGSYRLKVIKTHNRTLIIDVDQSILWILIPFYHWIFPINAYLIPNNEVEKIEMLNFEERTSFSRTLMITGIVTIISALLKPLYNNIVSNQSEVMNVVELLVAIIAVALLRFYIWKKYKKEVTNLEQYKVCKIKLKPKSVFFYFKFICITAVVAMLLTFSVGLQFTLSNVIYMLCIFTFFSLYLFLNTISVMSKKVCLKVK